MVGSRNYFDAEHDGNVNVTISKRQPGSSIKPINYATGLIKGYTASTPFIDQKICFPGGAGQPQYCPVNYDGKFHGVVQMRYALANSMNIPAVKMLKLNSLESMIATASAMGITTFDTPDHYGLSLTLGGGEVYMTDMAEAFGVFANSGYKIPLTAILKVSDSRGKVIEEYKPLDSPIFGKKVLPDGVSFIISDILKDNGARSLEFGSNSPLKIGNLPVSVKTGTTNDFRDNWTIGYTPNYVVAVWVGNNNNKPMSGIVSGITGAAPIWHDIMAHLVAAKPPKDLIKPDSVIGTYVCSDTGQVASSKDGGSCSTRYEYLLRNSQDSHGKIEKENVPVDKSTDTLAALGQTDNVEVKEKTIILDATGDKYCVDCAHPELITPTPTPGPTAQVTQSFQAITQAVNNFFQKWKEAGQKYKDWLANARKK